MEARRQKRGWWGCLFTAPLGCAAFLAGAVAVAVLLLPVAGGRLLSRAAEEQFRTSFRGRLAVERARLPSFHGRQELRFGLEDPEGRTVLDAQLEAPALPWRSLDREESWGPVEIRLAALAIVVGPDGVTNLEHALEPRPEGRAEDGSLQVSFGGVERIDLVFSIAELSWRASADPARGFELRDARGLGQLDLRAGARELSLAGSASPGEGLAPLAFELVLRSTHADLAAGRAPELRLRLAAREVSAGLVDALLSSGGEVERAFGPRLAPFSLQVGKSVGEAPSFLLEANGDTRQVLGPRAAPRLVALDGG